MIPTVLGGAVGLYFLLMANRAVIERRYEMVLIWVLLGVSVFYLAWKIDEGFWTALVRVLSQH